MASPSGQNWKLHPIIFASWSNTNNKYWNITSTFCSVTLFNVIISMMFPWCVSTGVKWKWSETEQRSHSTKHWLNQVSKSIVSYIKIGCQHNKGYAIIITISPHDTESALLDPPLRSLIRDPQIIIHGSADNKAKGLLGRSHVSNMYWWDMNFFDMITIEKRKEKLEREALSVMCPPTF